MPGKCVYLSRIDEVHEYRRIYTNDGLSTPIAVLVAFAEVVGGIGIIVGGLSSDSSDPFGWACYSAGYARCHFYGALGPLGFHGFKRVSGRRSGISSTYVVNRYLLCCGWK